MSAAVPQPFVPRPIDEATHAYSRFARRHRRYFLFLTKERLGGKSRVRHRIREGINDMALILGHDLIGLPEWQGVPILVGQEVARMIMDQMMLMLDDVLDLRNIGSVQIAPDALGIVSYTGGAGPTNRRQVERVAGQSARCRRIPRMPLRPP